MPKPILRITIALLLATLSYGCSDDDNTNAGPRCGDGVCSSNETPVSCSRDCSFACIPGATRCSGNSLVTCLDDGLHEETSGCEPDEVCAVDRCLAASEVGTPDVSTDVGDTTTVEDADAGGDMDEDLTDDTDVTEDAPTDAEDDADVDDESTSD